MTLCRRFCMALMCECVLLENERLTLIEWISNSHLHSLTVELIIKVKELEYRL